MRKITLLLILTFFTAFIPLDYATNNTTNNELTNALTESDLFVTAGLDSISTITDAYQYFSVLDTLNIETEEYSESAFIRVALSYKAEVLKYNNTIKQKFMDSIFSTTNITYALISQHKYKIPASVTLAQAYIESKSSKAFVFSKHIQYTNNYFGIKYRKNDLVSGKYPVLTREEFTIDQLNRYRNRCTIIDTVGSKYIVKMTDYFAVFDGDNAIEKSFMLHGEILNAYNIKAKKYDVWTHALVKKGYATSSAYASMLNKIIMDHKLYKLDYLN